MSAHIHEAILRLARGAQQVRRHAALTGTPESEAWANELLEAAHQVEGYYLALGQERAGQLDAGDPAQPSGGQSSEYLEGQQ